MTFPLPSIFAKLLGGESFLLKLKLNSQCSKKCYTSNTLYHIYKIVRSRFITDLKPALRSEGRQLNVSFKTAKIMTSE